MEDYSAPNKISGRVHFDDSRNIACIDGVIVSGEVLSFFTETTPPGVWFRVERKGNEVMITQRVEKANGTPDFQGAEGDFDVPKVH